MAIYLGRHLTAAALLAGLTVILGSWRGAGTAAAQAPPPPGSPGTPVNLCTGGSLEQSLDEVAAALGVTRNALRTAIHAAQQEAGALQPVVTGSSSSGLCTAQAQAPSPSSGTTTAVLTPPGGGSSAAMGQVTCTAFGSGQPTCTGPGSNQVRCTTNTGGDGPWMVTCTLRQPSSDSSLCPPPTVQGEHSGPTTVMGAACAGTGTGTASAGSGATAHA